MNSQDSSYVPQHEKPMILLVDDVAVNLQILTGTLKHVECRIAAVTSGPKALEMVNKVLPDLILLDIMMPEMTGFDVCIELKKNPAFKEIPIIFLTALNAPGDIVKGFELGAVDYITKPFNALELLARVRMHLELKKARDEKNKLILELQEALSRVKQLSGLLPICASCKKIRDDNGYWQQVEIYFKQHSDTKFSHSLCPDCLKQLYPTIADKIIDELKQ